jgi:hypothetical protein
MINILHCPLLSIWSDGSHLFFTCIPVVGMTRARWMRSPTASSFLLNMTTEMGDLHTIVFDEREPFRHVPLLSDGRIHNYTIVLENGYQVRINVCALDGDVYASSMVAIIPVGGDEDHAVYVPRIECTNEGWQ